MYARRDAFTLLRTSSSDSPAPPRAQLVTIVRATGASVVLSSQWREFPHMVKYLSEAMVAHGIPPPIDRTPSLLFGNRVKEIGAWLLENASRLGTDLRWITIDDLGLQGLGRHFVHTRSWGLTEEDVCRAISLLGTSSSTPSTASTDSAASCSVYLDRTPGAATEDAEDDGWEKLATLADGEPSPVVPPELTLSGNVEFKGVLSLAASVDGQGEEGSQDGEAVVFSGLERAADSMDLPFRLPGCCECTFCCDHAPWSSSCRRPKSPFHRLARKYSIM